MERSLVGDNEVEASGQAIFRRLVFDSVEPRMKGLWFRGCSRAARCMSSSFMMWAVDTHRIPRSTRALSRSASERFTSSWMSKASSFAMNSRCFRMRRIRRASGPRVERPKTLRTEELRLYTRRNAGVKRTCRRQWGHRRRSSTQTLAVALHWPGS